MGRLNSFLRKCAKKLHLSRNSKTQDYERLDDCSSHNDDRLNDLDLDYDDDQYVPRGCVPIYVGKDLKKYAVPTEYLGMPGLRNLIMNSSEEYLEMKVDGPLVITCCDTGYFEALLNVLKDISGIKIPKPNKKRKI